MQLMMLVILSSSLQFYFDIRIMKKIKNQFSNINYKLRREAAWITPGYFSCHKITCLMQGTVSSCEQW